MCRKSHGGQGLKFETFHSVRVRPMQPMSNFVTKRFMALRGPMGNCKHFWKKIKFLMQDACSCRQARRANVSLLLNRTSLNALLFSLIFSSIFRLILVRFFLQEFVQLGYAEAAYRISMSYYAWNWSKSLWWWWYGGWYGGCVSLFQFSA